jgi:hypothetical protein
MIADVAGAGECPGTVDTTGLPTQGNVHEVAQWRPDGAGPEPTDRLYAGVGRKATPAH